MKSLSMTSIVIVTLMVHFVVVSIMDCMKNDSRTEPAAVTHMYKAEPIDSIYYLNNIVQ